MNDVTNILQLLPKEQGTVYPATMEYASHVEVPYMLDSDNDLYTWVTLYIKSSDYHYRGLVNAVITLKYDESEAFAVLLNYMDDPDNEHYKAEYEAFQLWRKHAKEFAKNHFNIQ